jgi:hypothetical protein
MRPAKKMRKQLNVLGAPAQKYGKMPNDTRLPEYCSGTLAENAGIGFQTITAFSARDKRAMKGYKCKTRFFRIY